VVASTVGQEGSVDLAARAARWASWLAALLTPSLPAGALPSPAPASLLLAAPALAALVLAA
jgi:hypothetical protein